MLSGMQQIPLTVSETARRLKRSEATVRRLCDRGVLRAIRLANGTRLIDPTSIGEIK